MNLNTKPPLIKTYNIDIANRSIRLVMPDLANDITESVRIEMVKLIFSENDIQFYQQADDSIGLAFLISMSVRGMWVTPIVSESGYPQINPTYPQML
jgi:hypothetical protein